MSDDMEQFEPARAGDGEEEYDLTLSLRLKAGDYQLAGKIEDWWLDRARSLDEVLSVSSRLKKVGEDD